MYEKIIKSVFLTIIIFIGLFSIFFNLWLNRYFGNISFDLILININFGFRGLIDADDYVINKFIEYCIYAPTLFCIIILFTQYKIFKKKLLTLKLILINLIFFVVVTIFNFERLNFFENINIENDNQFLKKNYIETNLNKSFNRENKKDLILIYIESFEENYLENPAFENSIMEKLNFPLQKVPFFLETKFNNFTIGSIVSTQCGIPQKPIGIFDTRLIYKKDKLKHQRNVFGMKSFLPNATCLGDILKINNYSNTLIYSGDISFHAMDIFFSNHGYDQIFEKKYFDKQNNIPKNSWSNGVNDSVIFKKAFDEIKKYKQQNKNFNITILTTDNHFPGYVDPTCKNNDLSNDDLINSIHCTATSLHEFIENIFDSYKESVSIILLGDHLYPMDDIYNNHKNTLAINKNMDRSIYGRVLTDKKIQKRSLMTHYDFFPTILQSLNLNYGDRLGLGYTIFETRDFFDYDKYFKNLENNIHKISDFYYDFWK